MKRVLFIINPISGTRKKQGVEELIQKHLDSTLFEYDVATTTHAGHAAELAAAAARQGTDIVVAVGGDGTVNEVARSLVHTPAALGIIPCGSGNGLARHLQIPMDMVKAIQVINQDTVHCLDYGKINGLPFFCTCGMGFDAFISMKFAESKKRGLATYVEHTLADGLNYQPATYKIEDETNSVSYKAFLVACANASQYGNNAYIAPQASMKDGLLDVIVIEPFHAFEAPQIAFQLFSKTLLHNSHVKTFQTKKIRVTRSDEGPIHCDGDPFQTGRVIEVEVVSNSFNVVVNPMAHSVGENPLQIFSNYLSEWASFRDIRKTGEEIRRISSALLEKLRKL